VKNPSSLYEMVAKTFKKHCGNTKEGNALKIKKIRTFWIFDMLKANLNIIWL
jgi:hypothetical protein